MENKTSKNQDWTVFILRRFENSKVEHNTILGGFYSVIIKDNSVEEFNSITNKWDSDDLINCYGVVTFFDDSFLPLYSDSHYYIMTDTGSTVDNLSYDVYRNR